jgi:hypothetical protein
MEEPNFSYLNSFAGDKAFEGKILCNYKRNSLKKGNIYLNNITINKFDLAANISKHKISLLRT